jgi:membrane fusion protein (multidrug efflux system)
MAEDNRMPAEPTDQAPDEMAAPVRRSRGRTLRWLLLTAGPLLVLAVGGYIYLNSGRYAETDNAYVKADTVTVSTAVPGIIVKVAVEENQPVEAGDLLFVIDPESYEFARDRAKAQLEAVRSFVEGIEASYRQAMAQLELAKTDVRYAERDVEREQALADRDLGSESNLDAAKHTLLSSAVNRISQLRTIRPIARSKPRSRAPRPISNAPSFGPRSTVSSVTYRWRVPTRRPARRS